MNRQQGMVECLPFPVGRPTLQGKVRYHRLPPDCEPYRVAWAELSHARIASWAPLENSPAWSWPRGGAPLHSSLLSGRNGAGLSTRGPIRGPGRGTSGIRYHYDLGCNRPPPFRRRLLPRKASPRFLERRVDPPSHRGPTRARPYGAQYTPPVSPTLRCVLKLTCPVCTVYLRPWVFIALRENAGTGPEMLKESVEAPRATVPFTSDARDPLHEHVCNPTSEAKAMSAWCTSAYC